MSKKIKVNIENKEDLLAKVIQTRKKGGNAPSVFFYLNSGTYYYKNRDEAFLKAMERADYVYLNSYYLGLILGFFGYGRYEKINAEDFFYPLISRCRTTELRVFLLGAKPPVLRKAVSGVKNIYPGINLAGIDGYSKNDSQTVKKITRFRPDILIVGLGSGYQEPWVMRNMSKLKRIRSIVTVGNFIDILGQDRKMTPRLMRKVELEWLYRLMNEPGRLWKRYLFGFLIAVKEIILPGQSRSSRN